MDEEQIRNIAKRAFRAHVSEVKVDQVNVKPRLDHDGDPVVDVNIIYDGEYEQLASADLLGVQSDIVSQAWRNVEVDLGLPIVHFIPKSVFRERQTAAV